MDVNSRGIFRPQKVNSRLEAKAGEHEQGWLSFSSAGVTKRRRDAALGMCNYEAPLSLVCWLPYLDWFVSIHLVPRYLITLIRWRQQ